MIIDNGSFWAIVGFCFGFFIGWISSNWDKK